MDYWTVRRVEVKKSVGKSKLKSVGNAGLRRGFFDDILMSLRVLTCSYFPDNKLSWMDIYSIVQLDHCLMLTFQAIYLLIRYY